METHKVTLFPSNEVLEFNSEETLLSQLKKAGKNIKSSCGGCASCGDCVVVIKGGEFNLKPQTFEETRLLGNVFHITKERLSCQTKISGDVVLDISQHEKNTAAPEESVSKRPSVKVKKREELERKSQQNVEEKPEASWYRHWEKNEGEDGKAPKKLGGNKRPKSFKFQNNNEE